MRYWIHVRLHHASCGDPDCYWWRHRIGRLRLCRSVPCYFPEILG